MLNEKQLKRAKKMHAIAVTFETDELKENAVKAMENCMAYLTIGDMRMAHMNYGCATVWEEMLEAMGIYLDEEDEHFANMVEIYYEQGNR